MSQPTDKLTWAPAAAIPFAAVSELLDPIAVAIPEADAEAEADPNRLESTAAPESPDRLPVGAAGSRLRLELAFQLVPLPAVGEGLLAFQPVVLLAAGKELVAFQLVVLLAAGKGLVAFQLVVLPAAGDLLLAFQPAVLLAAGEPLPVFPPIWFPRAGLGALFQDEAAAGNGDGEGLLVTG